ncbi:MAG: C4-dicarboxylate ABC transporter permease [candidate division NC10 bacterium RIFCSPLOWO2_12_FULL_66_18]|nr:MAG: C4-dicarboxylate ABC transporter permease [candidate division NC10 bacterium RIFCSPLOWO2_02_FULL_66_22]OGB95986.1 MAG: C4-dicarboxylate ABC transporter permease [candidate division NC10 bacterium RIFCSPLOWO2_12_FULL_66_18]
MGTLAVFGTLVVLMLLGLPIAVSMGLTAILSFLTLGNTALLSMVPQRMYAGTTSFTLLAIPFFILAGNLMNTGGITQRLVRFAQCLVGHIRGGLGHVTVVTNMIMAGMSGSAVADATGTGAVLIPAMERAGYPRKFSAALVGAASTIGPVIPPSIPFVIFGSMTGTSVGRLFLGGFVPGVLMGVFLMVTVAIIAGRRGYPRERRASLRELLVSTLQAAPAWGAPVIIIGGILVGLFTPTEAAAVASVYALVLGMLVYREITPADLPRILWETVRNTVQVMFIISAASVFGWVLIQQRIPTMIVEGLMALTGQRWVLLLIVNAILLILGCFMEGIAIMLLTIPVFMPLVARVGMDPVHFGVMMTLNLMIGLLTPPVGMCLYAVSSISQVPLWPLAKELWPYIVALLACLALITYIPGLVVWFPNLVMGATR